MKKKQQVKSLEIRHYDGSTITIRHDDPKTKAGLVRALNRIRTDAHIVKINGKYYLVKKNGK